MDSQSALAELKSFQSTRKGAGDYQKQYQDELGVGGVKQRADDIRGLIRNTETALKGVGESVAGRTRGQLVTEAQRSRLANLEREPLQTALGENQGAYSDEMTNYRDLLGQAGQKAGLAYQTDADRLASLEGNYSKLFQSEQAAEARRQWEAQMAAQRDEANRSRALQERSLAQQASFANQGRADAQGSALKDQAYQSVQNFFAQGKNRAESDYRATKASADRGNAMDKLKVQLYNQLGIGVGSINKYTSPLQQTNNNIWTSGF